MLKLLIQTPKGPIGIIGINYENWRRLQAGMPLDIELKEITPPGMRINRVVVHYAKTYADVLKDIAEGGFEVPDILHAKAREMDEKVKNKS